jgi:predicted negative regulator of RcsB-dependent stress response
MSDQILNITIQNKIINFVKKNLKKIIFLLIFLILTLFSYFVYADLKKKNDIKLSEQYMHATIQFKKSKIVVTKQLMEDLVNKSHKFYSPLALYFLIENNLETDALKIINMFDKILSISSIDKENLNLIKIKKAFFLFSLEDEELIIKTLNPIINSESVWSNMAIKLMSDYFLSKGQKAKANEYIQLLNNKIKK